MAETLIQVIFSGSAEGMSVHGHTPLSWDEATPMQQVAEDRWVVQLDLDRSIWVKPRRNGRDWSIGENYEVVPGQVNRIFPFFEKRAGDWGRHIEVFEFKGDSVQAWVYRPPSYHQNQSKRYPVLYCQDGQALFDNGLAWDLADGNPHEWRLDETLNGLINHGLCDEVIAVGVEARRNSGLRQWDYTPWLDEDPMGNGPEGGGAWDYLSFLVDVVKPSIDAHHRTIPHENGILGASLGGLPAFLAGRVRPEIFTKVACLSTSWWWTQESILKAVDISDAHYPQKLYLDCGTGEQYERTNNDRMRRLSWLLRQDGYREGVDLLTRTFEGAPHSPAAWSERLDIPLQFLYPWQGGL